MQFQGYPISEARKELRCIQELSVDSFINWQEQRKWAIVKHHYDNNEYYRNKVGALLPDKWEDLPIITKQDLQRPLSQIITKGYNTANTYTANTSGSSGIPFFFAKDKYAHAMTWALIESRYKMHGIGLSSLQARFYGIPKEAFGYLKETIKDRLMHRRRFSVFDLSDNCLYTYLKKFEKHPFVYLYGYTNALVVFARYLLERNVVLKNICPSLKLCVTTSEMRSGEDEQLMRKAFGVKNIREYGVSETCITAFDMPDNRWALTEETLFTEIVNGARDGVTNELVGNILSTSLFNKALPIIRYQVGDRGTISTHNGRDIYRELNTLSGRINDIIQLPSGKKAAGLTFYYISRSILETTGILKEFIIRQTSIKDFVFDIVATRDLTEDETKLIKAKAELYLEPGIDILINRVDQIYRPASGKLKQFYSELK